MRIDDPSCHQERPLNDRSCCLPTHGLHGRSTKRTLCSAANSFARLRASSRASCAFDVEVILIFNNNQPTTGRTRTNTYALNSLLTIDFIVCSTRHYFFPLCGTRDGASKPLAQASASPRCMKSNHCDP